MIRFLILSLCILGFACNTLAYPISPRPLRKLVSESKYIAVGFVVKTFSTPEKRKKGKADWHSGSTTARIAILECLQGALIRDTIELEFRPNMICPAPDMYYENTHAICFLNEDEQGRLYTQALSYGSKTLSQEEILIYKTRILELQEISGIKDQTLQHTETVEWLVKCAEHETTRWEGTFELMPKSDFMSYYSKDKKEDFSDLLTASQKKRLLQALLNNNRIHYQDFALIDLTYKGNEETIDALLLNSLKTLEEDEYWTAGEYMKRLRYRNLTADMRRTMENYEELKYDDGRKAALKAIINDFIKLVE